MVLISTTPLYEMVWSQHEGLSFQYVTSSLAENKDSVLWNTENFSTVISSPKCANGEKASSSKDPAEGNSSSLRLKHSTEEVTSDIVVSTKEKSLRNIHEEESRTLEDLKLSNREEVELDMQNLEINQPNEKVDSSCDLHRRDADAIDRMHENDIVSGAKLLSRNLKELSPRVKCLTAVGSSHKHMKVSDQMEIGSVGHNLLTMPESPTQSSASSKSAKCGNINLALNRTVESANGRITEHLTSLKSHEQKSYVEGQSFNFGSNIQHEGGAKGEQLRASQKGKSALISSPSVDIMNRANTRKGKEKVLSETQDRKSTLNKSEDSNDSVESSNSKRVISSGKRERCCNLKISSQNKRLKRQIYEGSSSGSSLGRNSSFINWVSTITDGFLKFSDATPLTCVPPSSHHTEGSLNYLASSEKERKETGFKSLFQSLYLPGCNVKNSTNSNSHEKVKFSVHNLLRAKGEKANSPSDYRSNSQFDNGDELHNEVSMTMKNHDQNAHLVQEFPNGSSTDSRLQKSTCELRQSGSTAGSVVPACYYTKNGCQSLFDNKDDGKLVAVSESSPNSVPNKRTVESLWITRFFPKVATKPNSVKWEGTESLVKDCNVSNPRLQNSAADSKYYSSEQVPENAMNVKNSESSDNAGDPRLKSSLRPIVSSLKSQKTEPVAFSFARRLAILKDIKPNAPNNLTNAASSAPFVAGVAMTRDNVDGYLKQTQLKDLP